MRARHAKLITVLVFAVMLLILGLLVASVTSCAPMTNTNVQAAQPTATLIPHDGSIYHPWYVDATPYGNNDSWDVLTFRGHEHWREGAFLWTIKPGQYIWYRGAEYQVSVINRQALTMVVILIAQ